MTTYEYDIIYYRICATQAVMSGSCDRLPHFPKAMIHATALTTVVFGTTLDNEKKYLTHSPGDPKYNKAGLALACTIASAPCSTRRCARRHFPSSLCAPLSRPRVQTQTARCDPAVSTTVVRIRSSWIQSPATCVHTAYQASLATRPGNAECALGGSPRGGRVDNIPIGTYDKAIGVSHDGVRYWWPTSHQLTLPGHQ